MEQQLGMLIELQEMDLRIRALTEKRKRFPEVLASFEHRRTQNKEELDRTREGLQAAQKNKRDRDQDLEAGSQKVEKLKTRSSEIKTNKEYQAMLKEIEAAEKENKAIEDEILVLMEKIDAAASAITSAETRSREEEAAIAAEQKEQEAAFAGVEEELKAALQQRQESAALIDQRLVAQYQKLLVSKAGMALAEARGEACSGCYMSIPPQVFVNVKKNESVITCPHCGRILYYKG
ncbi:MAG TPA: C4-type zinc ribbon domain-containing protein [Nitrospirota bacterium]|nr:C4-type zinc ribbon domain-containing protein [Nitrospirota bacterium]